MVEQTLPSHSFRVASAEASISAEGTVGIGVACPEENSASAPLDREIFAPYRSKNDLCTAAGDASINVALPLKHTVFLYYIARYLVSVYEARYQELPIQVWNEYRNALDHFMRHVAASDGENIFVVGDHRHLQRMEGHVQRAVLDVCKILCVRSHDTIAKEVADWGDDVLDLIDGGSFRANVRQAQQDATDLLEEAKTNDAQLGHEASINRSVIERFLEAFFKFDEILRAFNAKHLTLANAKRQLTSLQSRNQEVQSKIADEIRAEIRPKAMRRSVYVGLATGIPLTILGSFLGWWLGITYPPPAPQSALTTQATPMSGVQDSPSSEASVVPRPAASASPMSAAETAPTSTK